MTVVSDIDVKIEYEGTERGASQIERLTGNLDSADAAQRRTGRSAADMGQSLVVMGGLAAGAAAAITAVAVAAAAAGEEMERRMAIVNRFGGSLDNLRERTGGLVTELQAMATHSELAARGIRLTSRDLNNVMVAALERSAATGRDFDTTLQNLTESLGAGSAEGLQRWGVELEAGATKTENVTTALDQLDAQLGDTNSAIDTAGGRVAQLTVALDDSGTAFAEAISNSGELEEAFTSLFNAVTGGGGDFEDVMDDMISSATTMGALVAEIIERLSATVSENVAGWRALASGDFAGAAAHFGGGLRAGAAALDVSDIGSDITQRVIEARESAAQRRSGDNTRSVSLDPSGGGRRGGRGGGGGPAQTFEQIENEAWERLRSGRGVIGEIISEGEEEREAATQRAADLAEALLNKQKEGARELAAVRIEAEEQAATAALEAMEKEKEARRNAVDERRAEMAEVASNLTRVTTAITGAFQSAIEGQQTLEEALISATKMILKSFGDEMVARGIGAILESISMLPSPLAAPKAAGGVAMVAFGVGLGAAGAAIPSPGGGAAAPREDAPSGDAEGPREVNIVFGNPVLTAQTTAQLSRTIRKGIAGDRTLPAGF